MLIHTPVITPNTTSITLPLSLPLFGLVSFLKESNMLLRSFQFKPIFQILSPLDQINIRKRVQDKTAKPGQALHQILDQYWYEGQIHPDKIILQDVSRSRRTRPTMVGQFRQHENRQVLIFYSDIADRSRLSHKNGRQGAYALGGLLAGLGIVVLAVGKGDAQSLGLSLLAIGIIAILGVMAAERKWPFQLDIPYLKRFAGDLANLLDGEYELLLTEKEEA